MSSELDQFYELMGELRRLPGQGRPLSEYAGGRSFPNRGVYFFFEPGEYRQDGRTPRVVRVGTHAVSINSRSKLWTRLRAHRGSLKGTGNHRGSIFRLHVGAALGARDHGNTIVPESWGIGASAPHSIRDIEKAHEQLVSVYIGRMGIAWLGVPDDAGPSSLRSTIERNAIALLSRGRKPIDTPSAAWLGRHSPRPEIRESGLWNLNYVDSTCDRSFLPICADLLCRMGAVA